MSNRISKNTCIKILEDVFRNKYIKMICFNTPANYGYDIQVFMIMKEDSSLVKLGVLLGMDNKEYKDAAPIYVHKLQKLKADSNHDTVYPIYMSYNPLDKVYHIYDILSLCNDELSLGNKVGGYRQMYIPYKYAKETYNYTVQKQVREERRNYNTDKVRKVRKDKGKKRGQYAPRTYKVVRTVQRSDKGKHHDFSNYYNRKQEQSNKETDITN